MTKTKLLEELKKLITSDDIELAHMKADDLLLQYIDDVEIAEVYDKILKWYA